MFRSLILLWVILSVGVLAQTDANHTEAAEASTSQASIDGNHSETTEAKADTSQASIDFKDFSCSYQAPVVRIQIQRDEGSKEGDVLVTRLVRMHLLRPVSLSEKDLHRLFRPYVTDSNTTSDQALQDVISWVLLHFEQPEDFEGDSVLHLGSVFTRYTVSILGLVDYVGHCRAQMLNYAVAIAMSRQE